MACLANGVTCYNVARVQMAEKALVSQGAYLCSASHDIRQDAFPLIAGDILIERDAWVAAEAFVGPGVSIGAGAVVGARAVVTKDVAAQDVMIGNPARKVGER